MSAEAPISAWAQRLATFAISFVEKNSYRRDIKQKVRDRTKVQGKTADVKEAPDVRVDSIQVGTRGVGAVSCELSNPSRLTPVQIHSCQFDLKQRYIPVSSSIKPCGIIILLDQQPGEPQDITHFDEISKHTDNIDESEPPAPFEWLP